MENTKSWMIRIYSNKGENMRIVVAHFGTHYVGMPGGVEKLTCYLSSHLVNKGYDMTVLYRDGVEGAPHFPMDEKVRQFNILFENGHQIISEKLPFHLRTYREIARLFNQSAAQEINAEYKGRQYGPRIRRFLQEYPADVILSCSAPSTKYTITDAGYKGPVVTMFRGDPEVQMPLLSREEREAVAKSAAIQVLWPSKVKIAKKYFPDVPIEAIGNAVFPAEIMANPGEKKERYLISCVGNVSGRKNQKLLMNAFLSLAEKYPDWDVEFWGRKDSHYAKTMEKEIAAKGLSDRIMLKGQTNQIGKVYGRSDIFCIPSTTEGFPQGLAEAMSAGIPAIGMKICGGTNELIIDGKTGYLVDNDEKSLSAALVKLMDDQKLRKEMGKAGHERVQEYAPDKMWDMWEELVQKISR